MFNISKEEKFNFDIANLKQDFAIEDINVQDSDVEILRKYYNNEITMNQMIDIIKTTNLNNI